MLSSGFGSPPLATLIPSLAFGFGTTSIVVGTSISLSTPGILTKTTPFLLPGTLLSGTLPSFQVKVVALFGSDGSLSAFLILSLAFKGVFPSGS